MFTGKRHKIVNAVFFILFFIYTVSPLTSSFDKSKKYLRDEGTFRAKDVSIFLVDFMYELITTGDDADSNEPEDKNIIIKKKRAVLKEFKSIEPLKFTVIPYKILNDLFAYDYPHVDSRRKDHKSNSKAFKGFLPLYSGVSPPIV